MSTPTIGNWTFFHSVSEEGVHQLEISDDTGAYCEDAIHINMDEVPAFIAALQQATTLPVEHDFRESLAALRARYGDDFLR